MAEGFWLEMTKVNDRLVHIIVDIISILLCILQKYDRVYKALHLDNWQAFVNKAMNVLC